jgi:hypothetical protein
MLVLLPFRPAALWLERRAELAQQRRDDDYLARAADHADLERRQREIARPIPLIPAYG